MLRDLFPRRLLQWLGPLIAAGFTALVVATIVVLSGVPNLAATTPHPQLWAKFLHFVFSRSVSFHSSDLTPPADLNSPNRVALGAAHYANVCANCHGAPGTGQNPIALAMTPRPPYLPAQIKDLNDKEIFWVLKHGVKYSAMPGWPTQLRDDEIWSMVAFVKTLPDLKYDIYRRVALGESASGNTNLPRIDFGSDPVLRPYVSHNSTIPQGDINHYVFPATGPDQFGQTGAVIETCSRCHGSAGTGRAVGAFPNLAILSQQYIASALTSFASGKRHSAYMQTVADQLSPQQIQQVAAYYSSQPKAKSLAAATFQVPAADVAYGQQIALQGLRDRKIGACSGCHALADADVRAYPRLNGQNEDYLINQLKLFRAGGRGNSGKYNPMVGVAKNLTDREIGAVSAYYAAQTPYGASVLKAEAKLVQPQRGS
ncbi:c-type cytochrome [Polymorphobacter sp. PAMC 29334]|uniref:c-type cytochrome n=1 Tax=Polymorphobacter sp. PAMC 29334 TaxID=2862331 RepID=UPI001C750BAD|nr:c-type cytochrome [Polymorphobacter sp. PAMC 29334]QYE34480.1 c-type cytochrome [Polymorphobacter sp. PAMC 29334]